MKILQPKEATSLYLALRDSLDPRDTFLALLFETGARVSEALALTATDLVGVTLGVPPLKGSLPRVVTLSPLLAAKLRHFPTRWADALGDAQAPGSHRRALCRRFHELTTLHLNRRLNLHALRHTAFTRLYLATKDLLLVKQWAGHRSINSTMVYMAADLRREADETNASLLNALVSNAD